MTGLPDPADVVERTLRAAGGPCVVIVEESREAEVRFANNTTTTNGVRLDRKVTAVRIWETSEGVTAGVSRQGGDVDVAALVEAAAQAAEPAEDACSLVEGSPDPVWTAHPADTDLAALAPVLNGLGGAFRRAEPAGVVLSGFAEHRMVTTYLGSSTGLRRRHVQPTGALHLVGRADGRSAWAGTGTDDFADATIEGLEERVRRGLDWATRTVEVDAGHHEVVLPPDAVADLMVFCVEAMSGRETEEGRTVFSRPGGNTGVGDTLSPLPFDLWSDPALPGIECAPFLSAGASGPDVSVFDNGAQLPRTDWVKEGRLARLRYHRAGAARSRTEPAFPIDNLALELLGATGSVEDLVARTGHGLLVTCLWYIRQVDPKTLLLTGLTRDGVYVVEEGKVVGAANNFRFNESPVDLLARVTEACATTRALGREFGEWMNRTAMPALRVPDFNMSSVSQAN